MANIAAFLSGQQGLPPDNPLDEYLERYAPRVPLTAVDARNRAEATRYAVSVHQRLLSGDRCRFHFQRDMVIQPLHDIQRYQLPPGTEFDRTVMSRRQSTLLYAS